MIYLASPYSHRLVDVRRARFAETQRITAKLMREGHHIYSPIVYCHPIAESYSMPTDFQFWQDFDRHMIELADHFWILTMPGWRDSVGVNAEMEYAESLGRKPFLVPYNEPDGILRVAIIAGGEA